jgi:RNA polymerase sigma-70 factor (sigma-E family)
VDDEARRLFGEFVASRTQALMALGYLLTGDRYAAEDLLQAALAKTYAKWRTLRNENPEAYVRTVMYRQQVSWWRQPRRQRESTVAAPIELAGPDPNTETDLRVAMRAALRELPPAQRAVIVLRYYEDLSETQVAETLGCSVGTVRSRTHRAVTALRALFPHADRLEVWS